MVTLHALRSQNLLFPLLPGSRGPNGGVFAILKTLDKCRLIVILVPVKREMPEKQSIFATVNGGPGPVGGGGTAKFIVFLALLLWLGTVPPGRSGRCWGSQGGGGGAELCICHIDVSNCFWWLRLPEAFWEAFRISDGEGGVLSFRCLPFGWKYSPILCHKVLERLVGEIGLVGVLILIYIYDVLILGWGKARVHEQAIRAVEALRAAGGVISLQTTLEPVMTLVWLGNDVDLGGGSLRTAGNAWEALKPIGCGPFGVCSMRHLQQFVGRTQWICRPRFGHGPHLSGVWAHVLWGAPPRLQFTPLKLLHSMCVACVLALPAWLVVPLMRVVCRQPVYVYVDAALDGGVYRLGLFSLELGSRSAVPHEQPPNQQCAEARVFFSGMKFILNVGTREAHSFGDHAAALV